MAHEDSIAMSHWLKKSRGNLQAASAMYSNKELCHASVHCGYYACLQLIKHILQNVIEPAIKLPRDATVHTEARNYMFHALGQLDRDSAIYFNEKFLELRVNREQSDYDDVEVTTNKAETAYKIASKVCQDIKDNFVHE
jgi:hypothetical protein